MWCRRLVVAGFLFTTAAPLQGSLTDQQVARAIARADKLRDLYVCISQGVAGEFSVCLQGPEQRISLAATLAKQAHQHYGPANVSGGARAQAWTIVVRPNPPALVDGRPVRTPMAEDLTLQLRGQPTLSVRPMNAARIPVTWDNAIGVTLKGQGLAATVDTSALPAGDVDVIVMVAGGTERRYLLSESARAQIR